MDKIIRKIKEMDFKKLLDNKALLGAILAALLIIALIIAHPSNQNKKQTKKDIYSHNEEGIVKEEEYKGIKFTNIALVTEKEYTTFTATATNTSEEDIKTEKFHVKFLNKDGNEIVKLVIYIPGGLKKKESTQINASVKSKLDGVTTKEITDYSIEKK